MSRQMTWAAASFFAATLAEHISLHSWPGKSGNNDIAAKIVCFIKKMIAALARAIFQLFWSKMGRALSWRDEAKIQGPFYPLESCPR